MFSVEAKKQPIFPASLVDGCQLTGLGGGNTSQQDSLSFYPHASNPDAVTSAVDAFSTHWQRHAAMVEGKIGEPIIVATNSGTKAAIISWYLALCRNPSLQSLLEPPLARRGRVAYPFVLGRLNSRPVYVIPTDGEGTGNEPGEQAVNKVKAVGDRLRQKLPNGPMPLPWRAIAIDTVLQLQSSQENHQSDALFLGKPAIETHWLQVRNSIIETQSDGEENLTETLERAWQLYQAWYLLYYLLSQEIGDFSKFYQQFKDQENPSIMSSLNQWFAQLKKESQDELLTLEHLTALASLGASDKAAKVLQLRLKLELAVSDLIDVIRASLAVILDQKTAEDAITSPHLTVMSHLGGAGLAQQLLLLHWRNLLDLSVTSPQEMRLENHAFVSDENNSLRWIILLFHIMGVPLPALIKLMQQS